MGIGGQKWTFSGVFAPKKLKNGVKRLLCEESAQKIVEMHNFI